MSATFPQERSEGRSGRLHQARRTGEAQLELEHIGLVTGHQLDTVAVALAVGHGRGLKEGGLLCHDQCNGWRSLAENGSRRSPRQEGTTPRAVRRLWSSSLAMHFERDAASLPGHDLAAVIERGAPHRVERGEVASGLEHAVFRSEARSTAGTGREPRIVELRRLHEEMDRAVLDAYAWSDLEVPPYCPSTPAEEAAATAFADEVVDRLFQLNAERAKG